MPLKVDPSKSSFITPRIFRILLHCDSISRGATAAGAQTMLLSFSVSCTNRAPSATASDRYFSEKSLTDEELIFARKSVQFNNFKVSKEEKIEKQAYGNIILAFVFAILLYMSLIMSGSMTMTAVIEEKTSRIKTRSGLPSHWGEKLKRVVCIARRTTPSTRKLLVTMTTTYSS